MTNDKVEKAREVVRRKQIKDAAEQAGVSEGYAERVGFEDVSVVKHGNSPLTEEELKLIHGE